MNKKKIIIAVILAIVVIGLVAFLFLRNKNNGELFKLTDKYNSLEVTLKYPKEAGFTTDEFNENYTTDFPEATFRNEQKNYQVDLTFRRVSGITYENDTKSAKESENFSEVEYNKYSGYKYERDGFGQIEMVLKLKQEETTYVILSLIVDKIDFNKETDLNEIFNSKEFQKILKTFTFSDQIEDKKEVTGVMSSNHKLVINPLTAPNSDYTVSQYEDAVGVMNAYILNSDKSQYNNSGVYFRLFYYGDEGNYKDLATFQQYKEETFELEYIDADLFGNPVKKEVSTSELPSKYTRWDAGLMEKDGKVYEFLYYIYSDVDDSIGEKLVENVFSNVETK